MPRSVMQHNFATVPRANIPRSSFNRSSGLKTTLDADFLIPIYLDMVMPNDTFNMHASAVIRLNSPTLHPLMDNMKMDIHWFYVTCRHIWVNWARMHGAQDDPGDTIAYTTPILTRASAFNEGDLAQYMGVPIGLVPDTTDVNALPFRAYRKIFDEWYRDENLQNSQDYPTDDGPDTTAEVGFASPPLKRGKRYDYFTSALPSLQKGTAVGISLTGYADVGTLATDNDDVHVRYFGHSTNAFGLDTQGGVGDPVQYDDAGATSGQENLITDLGTASAISINDLRLSIATQRLLERDARSGTRYKEHLLAHFGSDDGDLRLGRSEFLSGGSIPIHINAVPNTSASATVAENATQMQQGELSGYGMGTGSSGFVKTFKEWGYILGIASVVGDITYSQGLDRIWSTSTRYDYPYPILANIGEEIVRDQEIWHDPAGTNNQDVWGYQPRYEWLRFKNSRNTGLMDVDATGTLGSWHLQEDFAARPSLDSTFIESNLVTPLDRAIAIPSEPQFNVDFYFKLTCARPLPLNGVPGLTRL